MSQFYSSSSVSPFLLHVFFLVLGLFGSLFLFLFFFVVFYIFTFSLYSFVSLTSHSFFFIGFILFLHVSYSFSTLSLSSLLSQFSLPPCFLWLLFMCLYFVSLPLEFRYCKSSSSFLFSSSCLSWLLVCYLPSSSSFLFFSFRLSWLLLFSILFINNLWGTRFHFVSFLKLYDHSSISLLLFLVHF